MQRYATRKAENAICCISILIYTNWQRYKEICVYWRHQDSLRACLPVALKLRRLHWHTDGATSCVKDPLLLRVAKIPYFLQFWKCPPPQINARGRCLHWLPTGVNVSMLHTVLKELRACRRYWCNKIVHYRGLRITLRARSKLSLSLIRKALLCHEDIRGNGGIASSFLTSALDGGECSASRSGRFTPCERAPHTHGIGGWVGPRAGLDAVE
jgi:hypothetical protein